MGEKYRKHDFCRNRSNIKYIECKFSNRYRNPDLEVKTGEHLVPPASRFMYPRSTIQSGGKREGDQP